MSVLESKRIVLDRPYKLVDGSDRVPTYQDTSIPAEPVRYSPVTIRHTEARACNARSSVRTGRSVPR